MLCGKGQHEDSSEFLVVHGKHNRFCNGNGKWVKHSFKGHTTVTDEYLEFFSLILIMISMCMLKVKEKHLNELCSPKSFSQANTLWENLTKQEQKDSEQARLTTEGTRYYFNSRTQRQPHIMFTRWFIFILIPFLKCKKLQYNSHTPIIWSLSETLQIREILIHKSETAWYAMLFIRLGSKCLGWVIFYKILTLTIGISTLQWSVLQH